MGKNENAHTQYYVYVLEANLAFHNGMVIPLLSEFLEYEKGDSENRLSIGPGNDEDHPWSSPCRRSLSVQFRSRRNCGEAVKPAAHHSRSTAAARWRRWAGRSGASAPTQHGLTLRQ